MRVFIFFSEFNQNVTSKNRINAFLEVLKEFEVIIVHFEGQFSTQRKNASAPILFQLYYKALKFQLPFLRKLILGVYQIIFKRAHWAYKGFVPLNELISKYQINDSDILIATSPSFETAHYVYEISNIIGANYILDYRDPHTFGYTKLGYPKWFYCIYKLRLRQKETQLLLRAHSILTVSHSLKNYFPIEVQHKIHILENGVFSSLIDMKTIETRPNSFNIVFNGTLYNEQLEEDVFFKTIMCLKEDVESFKEDLRLIFMGTQPSSRLKKLLHKYGLRSNAVFIPRVQQEEAYKTLAHACLFLHLRYEKRKHIITSKHYDYLAFLKPIWLPVSDSGDLEESILKHKAGFVGRDLNDNLEYIKGIYQQWKSGHSLLLEQNEHLIKDLDRAKSAEIVLQLLKNFKEESDLKLNNVSTHSPALLWA